MRTFMKIAFGFIASLGVVWIALVALAIAKHGWRGLLLLVPLVLWWPFFLRHDRELAVCP